MTRVTVSPGGQIEIPPDVREELHIEPGTELVIDVRGQSVVMRRADSGTPDWRTMEGMIPDGPSLTKALEEEHEAELALEDERIHRS